MDIRAFGSTYGQTSPLPYASGYTWTPSLGRQNFPTCRAIFVEGKAAGGVGSLTFELSDAPGQALTTSNLKGDNLIPIACTAMISGTVHGVLVLF